MPDGQDKNKGKDLDLDVFRVPPKEMLERLSQTPKNSGSQQQESSASPKKDTDISKTYSGGQIQTGSRQVDITPQKPQTPYSYNQPVGSEADSSSSLKPLAKYSSISQEQNKASLGPRPKPYSPNLSIKSQPKLKPKRKILTKTRIGLVVGAFFLLLLLAIGGAVWAEWQGFLNLGAWHLIGPPPAKTVWSKAVLFSSPLSFSGKITLKNSNGELKKWWDAQGWKQQEISFSGEVATENDELLGFWQWLDEPYFEFYLKGHNLYLRKQGEKDWFGVDLGFTFSGIDSFWEFLENPVYFQRLEADQETYWYKGNFSHTLLSNLGVQPEVKVGLFRKNLSLKHLEILAESAKGLEVQFVFSPSESSLSIKEKEVAEAKDGQERFAAVLSFVEIWKEKTEKEVSSSESLASLRDRQRKQDLESISQALAKYYQQKGSYPLAEEKVKIEEANDLWSVLEPYLSGGEDWGFADPKYPDFYYGYISDGENYELSARLENKEDKEGVAVGEVVLYFITSDESYNPSLSGL